MSEEKKKQSRPLNQKEVEEMLERGESFEGLEIGDILFNAHQFENHVNFYRANFVGSVDFYFTRFLNGANFVGTKFSGESGANFSKAEFSGEDSANFIKATFSGKAGANFVQAKFSGKGGANFLEATFSGDEGADFSFANFSGEGVADFHGVEFNGKEGVEFSFAEFSGKGGADFGRTVFSGKNANFSYAEFLCEDRISFEDVEFGRDCIINFDNLKIKNPKNLFFRKAYLGNTIFYQTDVEEFNFKNVKFRKYPPNEFNWLRKI
ncbi:MAG: pentapeptide repeat-containing protein, partial [Candidatus Marinimicrobia bacterium]|nr:pentapeptide repeat-containing protein [Candidatus Neomarinimicrobiota bacterium]